MARRIALLGGTFDPIHIGHLRGALEVLEQAQLDELRLVPNATPPHRKAPGRTPEQRLAMVHRAVADVPSLTVDDRELSREQPSYTIDTLISIRQELAADDVLILVLGWDAFCGLPSWHRWQELLDYCHILVMQRPDLGGEPPQELRDLMAARDVGDALALVAPSGDIAFIWQTPLEVSATQIRHLLANNKCIRFLVPDAVLAYINAHELYRVPNEVSP